MRLTPIRRWPTLFRHRIGAILGPVRSFMGQHRSNSPMATRNIAMFTAFRCGNRVPGIGPTGPTGCSVSGCRALPVRTPGRPGFTKLHERESGVTAPVRQGVRAADALISGDILQVPFGSIQATLGWPRSGKPVTYSCQLNMDVPRRNSGHLNDREYRSFQCMNIHTHSSNIALPGCSPKSGLGGSSCIDGSCLWLMGKG